jgi:hypothetical protein
MVVIFMLASLKSGAGPPAKRLGPLVPLLLELLNRNFLLDPGWQAIGMDAVAGRTLFI